MMFYRIMLSAIYKCTVDSSGDSTKWLITFTIAIAIILSVGLFYASNEKRKSVWGRWKGNKEVWNLVSRQKFSEAMDRISKYPQEARYISSHGDTVLHLSCMKNPDCHFIRALITAYPESATLTNGFGCRALHVACRFASEDVVRLLLEVSPESAKARTQNRDTPLMLMVWPRSEHKVIKAALEAVALPEHSRRVLLQRDDKLRRIWYSACYLVQVELYGRIIDDMSVGDHVEENEGSGEEIRVSGHKGKFHMVHACVRIKKCPANLLALALKWHPEQLLEVDEFGCLPLHYAMRRHDTTWETMIEKLVRACPSSVTVPDPESGLYPFMALAAESRAPLTAVYTVLRLCPEFDRFK